MGATQIPTVLVGCDDESMGRLFDSILGDVGYPTRRVRKGADLLSRLQGDGQAYVALSSLRWPPVNSRAVLEAVAADAALATYHRYVLVTALWDMLPADYVALLRRLDVPVVPKPFHLETLLKAVAGAAARLERTSARRQHTAGSVSQERARCQQDVGNRPDG
jgi:DNA-binding NtrC family response regulator